MHRELDVADAAAAQLYFALRKALERDRSLGAGLHCSQGPQVVGSQWPPPHTRRGLFCKGSPQLGVPGGRPGLEQGLELPGLCPTVPIREVGGEAAHQRAGAAFGAEPEVGAPGLADEVDQRLGVAAAN